MVRRSLFPFVLLSFLYSCSKDCTSENAACQDTPPINELCAAYFSRWFYNEESNSCEEIGYSGCSEKGFETKAECESCGCQ